MVEFSGYNYSQGFHQNLIRIFLSFLQIYMNFGSLNDFLKIIK
jgi:hypothetical protein